jgi:hypothetical protein
MPHEPVGVWTMTNIDKLRRVLNDYDIEPHTSDCIYDVVDALAALTPSEFSWDQVHEILDGMKRDEAA